MHLYNNTEKLNLSDKEIAKVKKLTADIYQSMEFFGNVLTDHDLNKTDVYTHMGLFEHYFSDLSKIVGYDSIIAEEKENRIAETRILHQKIYELEKEIGTNVAKSPETVSAALRTYMDLFSSWYKSLGFHYASLKTILSWGMEYEFSADVYPEAESNATFPDNKSLFGANSQYDLYPDRFHSELLDTDKNKELLEDLFKNTFPDSRICGYNSRPGDERELVLRMQVIIPFSNLAQLSSNKR